MRSIKTLGLGAIAAMVLTTYGVSNVSATTLEVGGVTQNQQITITETIKSGTSLVISRTDGSLANTCTSGDTHWESLSPYITAKIGLIRTSTTLSNCERPVTVHKAGGGGIEHISGTTDGTVTSSGAEVTVGSIFGTLNCKTGAGVDLGRLTGTDGTPATHAEVDISAVLDCGFLVPSASMKGTYVVTSPAGLGVSA